MNTRRNFILATAVASCVTVGILALAACSAPATPSQTVLAAQTPGQATGAGATFTGPANSAAPSTQTAERRVGFYPKPIRQMLPRYLGGEAKSALAAAPQPTAQVVAPPSQVTTLIANATAFDAAGAPEPAWIDEKVTTTYGQHQDAAMLIKAAGYLSSWGKMRWIGLLCLFIAYSGLLWAHGNDESGYPVVCWKVGACGIVFFIVDASLWWLLLLLIPAGLYFGQKLKLLRLVLP